ncbi:MAG TPA: HAMP domain-containing sensor histidine kinase [Flavobacterium sp.]|uniref:sensor histidine kinase n=1 Tax=Flavobacterium sp. TaxID=239 RepID=UPI002BDBD9BD|nr:HAMP domain-containing sensor histidine kinase [Flavobacterium sp.]HNP33819.1 HAMP domain-containing sensor histidine kinase [Flavobacterium sp.]
MNDTETYNPSEQERESRLIDKINKANELNAMLLNLFYTVSHNLNAYTSNIKMLLDLIDFEEDPAENRKNLDYLRLVSNDLNKTITDLSQIVYVQNSSDIIKEKLNLNEFLNKVKNVIDAYSIDDKLRFINKVPNDVYVNYNPAYLESILLNFSTNAIKYAHPERFPTIEFGYSVDNTGKVLTITDNGLGIDLERYGTSLFGLNQTFHQHENANGIGLYITKYQIEAMKGMVSVSSKVGEGTTFKIHFSE